MKNGLPSNFCYKLLQDKRGYIWFATINGAVRFDGKHYKYFQEKCSNINYTIPSNWVLDLTEDDKGNIWINTNEGICKYDIKKDSIINYNSIIRGWGKICFIKPNKLYVSSWAGIDYFLIKNDSLFFIKNYTETSNNSIMSLSNINDIIYATPEDNPSLITIKNNDLQYFRNIKLNKTNKTIILNSVSKYNNSLLLNSRNLGLLIYQKGTYANSFLEKELAYTKNITCSKSYFINKVEFIVVGTNGNGIFIINKKSKKTHHIKHNNFDVNSLPSDIIQDIIIDTNNSLWISTDKGVTFFNPTLQKIKYNFFYNNRIIPKNILINCIEKTNNKETIIGTESDGLFIISNKNNTTKQLLFKTKINAIEKTPHHSYLIATNKGIYKYANNNIIPYLKNINVLNLKKLNDSLLAICSQNGLIVYNFIKEKYIFKEKKDSSSQADLFVKDAVIDKNGIVWMLKLFNGYCNLNLKTKTLNNLTPIKYKNKAIDYHNIILSNDSNYILISSTSGIIEQNINSIDKYKIYTTKDGLTTNTIENICRSFNNTIYYSTSVGLYEYNKKKNESNLIYNYENYSQKWINQLRFSEDSILLSSISNYYISFAPNLIFKNNFHPKSHISNIYVNNTSIKFSKDKPLELNNTENNLKFEISSCSFIESDKNNLYYKLNTDKDWKISKNGDINFYNLSPNKYLLTYYETNNEGIKTINEKTFYFTISPPFYNSLLFKLLLLLIISGITFILFYFKNKSRKKVDKIREQISRDLHDELGSNVSSINILAQLIKSNNVNQKNSQLIEKLSSNSNQISQTINDIIWNVNPKFDNLESLINKINRYATSILDSKETQYNIDTSQFHKNIKLSNVKKYNLYLICKEAINNAVKYSKAKTISLSIYYQSTYIIISIEDDGIGFNSDAYDIGNGLNNMHQRAKIIKAELSILSKKNKGTLIKIKLK